MDVAPNIVTQYVYENENGVLKGGYPLLGREDASLKTGGATVQYGHLSVPIGLVFVHERHAVPIHPYEDDEEMEHADDDMLDRMLESVMVESRDKASRNTKKERDNGSSSKKSTHKKR